MSGNSPVTTTGLPVPGYIPSAAAAYIRWHHETLKQELVRTRLDILILQGDKSVKGISALNNERRRARISAALLRRLENLTAHPDMRGAYSRLSKVINHDSQWNAFICAAISLCGDYKEVQDGIRRRADQMDEIAKAATRLALLLRAAESTGGIPNSLADAHAVSVVDLIAQVSAKYKPASCSAFDAALAGRKRAPTSDYIRAFAGALTDSGFEIKSPVITAIAIAVSACNNDRKAVTSEDVRKALNFAQRRKS